MLPLNLVVRVKESATKYGKVIKKKDCNIYCNVYSLFSSFSCILEDSTKNIEDLIQLYVLGLVFAFFLPVGFVNLFIDSKIYPAFFVLSSMFVGVLFITSFIIFVVACKTMPKKSLVIFYIVILIVFILSMKGCVSIFGNTSFAPGLP